MGDAARRALDGLLGALGDERPFLDELRELASPGGLSRWSRARAAGGGSCSSGWQRGRRVQEVPAPMGYAGDSDEALHLALMVELPDYP